MTEPSKSVETPAPGWITLPARIIALVIVIPLRLVYDVLRMTGRPLMTVGRGIRRSPRDLTQVLRTAGRWIRDTLLVPVGRALAALFDLLVVKPSRWLAVVVVRGWRVIRLVGSGVAYVADAVWAAIRVVGSGIAYVARAAGAIIRPLGSGAADVAGVVIRLVGSGLAYVADAVWAAIRIVGSGVGDVAKVMWAGVRLVGSGTAWVFDRAVMVPLRLLARGARWLLPMAGRGGATAFHYLVGRPAVVIWRYVLRPSLVAISYVGRQLWKGIVSTWLGTIAALGWAWHASGRLLSLLFRLLVLAPANLVWLYVLRPVWQRLARVLRWLWMHMAVAPFRAVRRAGRWTRRTFVTDPARWVRDSVLRPARQSVRHAWQVSVRQPLRQTRLTVRATMKETRQQLRMQFRGVFRRTRSPESALFTAPPAAAEQSGDHAERQRDDVDNGRDDRADRGRDAIHGPGVPSSSGMHPNPFPDTSAQTNMPGGGAAIGG